MRINRIFLSGRLGRDPEIRYSHDGKPIANFSIAYQYKKDADTDWYDVTAFGRSAEFASQWLRKGQEVLVEGRLQMDRWEKDGQKRSKVKLVAFELHPVTWPEKREQAQSDKPTDSYDDQIPF